MNARTIVVGFVLSLALACEGDDDDDGRVDEHCDARPDDPSLDTNAETCKAVGLIVDCLGDADIDADDLTDDQLHDAIDDCATLFDICYVDPGNAGNPEAVAYLELREQSNMCAG